jgi:hypothetical protein
MMMLESLVGILLLETALDFNSETVASESIILGVYLPAVT